MVTRDNGRCERRSEVKYHDRRPIAINSSRRIRQAVGADFRRLRVIDRKTEVATAEGVDADNDDFETHPTEKCLEGAVLPRHDTRIRDGVRRLKRRTAGNRLTDGGDIIIHVQDMTYTATGPQTDGRARIADVYRQKLHSSRIKMLRHSVGSPWHCSSICSHGKIGRLRSQ